MILGYQDVRRFGNNNTVRRYNLNRPALETFSLETFEIFSYFGVIFYFIKLKFENTLKQMVKLVSSNYRYFFDSKASDNS